VELIERWLSLAGHGSDAAPVRRAAAWLFARRDSLPRHERGRIFSSAAHALDRLDEREAASELWQEAAASAPSDPSVLLALSTAQERRGDHDGAVRSLDRAAAIHEDDGAAEEAAQVLVRAALLLEAAERIDAAERRLVRAFHLAPDPATICALARVRKTRGAHDEASATYDELLLLSGTGRADGLVEAAAYHLSRGRAVDAEPFVEAFERACPDDVRGSELRRSLVTAGQP
jgi:tetratricopeptide (TPR) repeat protein